jgi:hypothetical protein
MPQSLRLTGCTVGLAEKEIRLRLVQADDAVNDLRCQLQISAAILDFKKTNIGGTSQRRGVKMHNLMARFHEKSHRGARRYDAAFWALLALDPNGAWTSCLKHLDHSKDLRLPRRDQNEEPSEGRRELSWIWLIPQDDRYHDSGEEYTECKSLCIHMLTP